MRVVSRNLLRYSRRYYKFQRELFEGTCQVWHLLNYVKSFCRFSQFYHLFFLIYSHQKRFYLNLLNFVLKNLNFFKQPLLYFKTREYFRLRIPVPSHLYRFSMRLKPRLIDRHRSHLLPLLNSFLPYFNG